jgi:tetratricopeptide (TPR) repeat protein
LVISNIASDFAPEIISNNILGWLGGKPLPSIKTPINIPMGIELSKTGSIDSAFNLYTNLKKNDPDKYDFSEEAISQLGVNLFYRLNRKKDALRVYQFCAFIYPNSAYAYLNLAEAYVLQKDTIKADQFLKKAKAIPIKKPEIIPRLAYIEEMIKNYAKRDKPN